MHRKKYVETADPYNSQEHACYSSFSVYDSDIIFR